MNMSSNNLFRHVGRHMKFNDSIAATKHIANRPSARKQLNNTSVRSASTSSAPSATQYHIPKRLVHIGVPLLVTAFAILRLTDPTLAPQPARKLDAGIQPTCNKVHARDLDRYIKANLDGISDEHAIAWNRMYNDFKTNRKNEGESARIEKENARLLAQYARIEDNKSRSTKMEGIMATHGGNRNISHRPETVGEAVEGKTKTFGENLAARWDVAKRRITKVTKGSALF